MPTRPTPPTTKTHARDPHTPSDTLDKLATTHPATVAANPNTHPHTLTTLAYRHPKLIPIILDNPGFHLVATTHPSRLVVRTYLCNLLAHPEVPPHLISTLAPAALNALEENGRKPAERDLKHLLNNPNTPNDTLNLIKQMLHRHPHLDIPQSDVNQHINATPTPDDPNQALKNALTNTPWTDDTIRNATRANRHTHTLENLWLQQNPTALALGANLHPHTWRSLITSNPNTQQNLLHNPLTPSYVLETLQQHLLQNTPHDATNPPWDVAYTWWTHPNTTHNILHTLAEYGTTDLHAIISNHHLTNHQTLHLLALNTHDPTALTNIATHKNTSLETLDHIIQRHADTELASIARNHPNLHQTDNDMNHHPQTRQEALIAALAPRTHNLHRHDNPIVRLAVALNPNTTTNALHTLTNDADARVRTAARQTLNTPTQKPTVTRHNPIYEPDIG